MVTWKKIDDRTVSNFVKEYGVCARVNVPVSWIGRKVKVVLLDAPEKPQGNPEA